MIENNETKGEMMNMTKLQTGCDAMRRGVFLRKELNQIEVCEDESNPYNLLTARTFALKPNTEEGWRDHNMTVLRELHEFVRGGEGRHVDDAILRGWIALGLPDRSVHVDMTGHVME